MRALTLETYLGPLRQLSECYAIKVIFHTALLRDHGYFRTMTLEKGA